MTQIEHRRVLHAILEIVQCQDCGTGPPRHHRQRQGDRERNAHLALLHVLRLVARQPSLDHMGNADLNGCHVRRRNTGLYHVRCCFNGSLKAGASRMWL